MDPIIKTENLSVIYDLGKSNESAALQDINIQIYPGEYIIFFGPSGCGKSTLLYCLTGLEVPTKGEIFIEGKATSAFDPKATVNLRRKKIGMIFQAYNLIPTLSVLDNVVLPTVLGGESLSESKKKAKVLLERFGIANFAHRYPGELSGGQQQRVAIARSLIYWPPILFADEPVGNLDSESAKNVMKSLLELNEKDKRTIILVTHDASYLNYAHRVFHMKDGRILRVVTNQDRESIAPKAEKVISPEIEAICRAYPNLSEAQVKAKALAQYLLTSLDEPEIERLEKFIAQRITGEIEEPKFIEMLDKPLGEGGAGLYRQTAQNFVQKIEKILSEADFIQQKIIAPKRPFSELDVKAEALRRYLLDGSDVSIRKEEELQRLDHFIKLRLEKRINKAKFQKFLDMPFAKGGVGLNIKTARDFAKKLELALIKY